MINELSTLVTTNTATDPDLPANTLKFSLEPGAPAGASINATNGVFTWTPTEAQGPSTNLITVRVTDDGSPPSSDSRSFTVVVVVAPPPIIESIVTSEGSITIRWRAGAGRSYRVQYTSNLDEPMWSDLGNVVTANGSTATQTDVTTSGTERYYRVVLLP
jgi:hypothetical protein